MNETPRVLQGTQPLTLEGDLAAQMVAGIDAWLGKAVDASVTQRDRRWKRDVTSHDRYVASIEPNRARFRTIIGATDVREEVVLHEIAPIAPSGNRVPAQYAKGDGYTVHAVRWNVLTGMVAEGLLLVPDGPPVADIIALPDCDWTPEMLVGLAPGVPDAAQFGRRLAEQGCRVLIPLLINRACTHSGIPAFRMTNQPHREFLYRAAYQMGRHIIGYEVQKILAGVDWFTGSAPRRPIGVAGYGEGGLLAFYAAAADTRIDAALVSGYFQSRETLFREPIYRNVWGLLDEFGDAEIASLIAPRSLIVEASRHPEVVGPPPPTPERSGAAPGFITTPSLHQVTEEFSRARGLVADLHPSVDLSLVISDDGNELPGTDDARTALLTSLTNTTVPVRPVGTPPVASQPLIDAEARLACQFHSILEHTQYLMREGEFRRGDFWAGADASTVESWTSSVKTYRDYLWDEIIGRLPVSDVPINPRTRQVYATPAFTGYEVVLDVYDTVFAYGILLVPSNIPAGERRPVVVCQHGLEGRPQDVADPAVDNHYYHRYACALAERGYVTYAPQNPYIGGNTFRETLRKAHPLKLSLYAFIVRQHEQTLEWLASLPFVDPERLAFYGLSYGGKTAMRIPTLLDRYCLSICSADYNEWIWKNVSARHRYSYLITGEYDMPEFDLGNTFNYAELSWLMCPRPFMVERGHHDGVAPDEWVAYEYAKTQRRYVLMGIGDRTALEVFNGPHSINGDGTFAFLDRHLLGGAPQPQ